MFQNYILFNLILIGDYYTSLTLDKRFILLDNHEWDLRENHAVTLELDDEDEEEVESFDEEEEETEEENMDDNLEESLDDEIDDDAEDDLEDLTVVEEEEEI